MCLKVVFKKVFITLSMNFSDATSILHLYRVHAVFIVFGFVFCIHIYCSYVVSLLYTK